MTQRVKFETKTGTIEGELALPAGDAKAPAVVLIQEYWGINDHIRSLVDRLAAAGFVAIAPDLYDGVVAKTAAEAQAKMNALDWGAAIVKIDGATAFVGAHPRSNGHVGILGFCMGGAVSLMAATHIGSLRAVVSFYGQPPLEKADWSKLHAPVQTHVATRDQWVTVESAKALESTLKALGRSIEMNVYEADHAFCNDTRPEVHDPAAAKLAWDRATTFLHAHLD